MKCRFKCRLVKNDNGFTLVELIVVIAILAVLGAILVPNFINSTDKAKLKSDIQSARVLQSQVELYDMEQSSPLPKASLDTDMATLLEKNYIKNTPSDIQTPGAKWTYSGGKVVVDISACADNVKAAFAGLSAQEENLVTGGGSS